MLQKPNNAPCDPFIVWVYVETLITKITASTQNSNIWSEQMYYV